jgi:membrane protein
MGDHLQRWLRLTGRILKGAGRDMMTDRIIEWAGAVAFFAVLSLFPLMLAGVTIASYFVDPHWAIEHADQLISRVLPGSAETVEAAILEAYEARSGVGLISFGLLLWFGSQVFNTLTIALNVAFDVDEPHGFLKRILIQFVMMATVGALFLLALVANFGLDRVWGEGGLLPGTPGLALDIAKWLVPVALLFAAFTLCYRFIPRGRTSWRAALVGAGVATLLFRVVRPLFVMYVETAANYPLIYGSLAVVVVVLLWAWIASIVTLFGGEVASHFHMLVLEGKTDQEVKDEHVQRAPDRRKLHPA